MDAQQVDLPARDAPTSPQPEHDNHRPECTPSIALRDDCTLRNRPEPAAPTIATALPLVDLAADAPACLASLEALVVKEVSLLASAQHDGTGSNPPETAAIAPLAMADAPIGAGDGSMDEAEELIVLCVPTHEVERMDDPAAVAAQLACDATTPSMPANLDEAVTAPLAPEEEVMAVNVSKSATDSPATKPADLPDTAANFKHDVPDAIFPPAVDVRSTGDPAPDDALAVTTRPDDCGEDVSVSVAPDLDVMDAETSDSATETAQALTVKQNVPDAPAVDTGGRVDNSAAETGAAVAETLMAPIAGLDERAEVLTALANDGLEGLNATVVSARAQAAGVVMEDAPLLRIGWDGPSGSGVGLGNTEIAADDDMAIEVDLTNDMDIDAAESAKAGGGGSEDGTGATAEAQEVSTDAQSRAGAALDGVTFTKANCKAVDGGKPLRTDDSVRGPADHVIAVDVTTVQAEASVNRAASDGVMNMSMNLEGTGGTVGVNAAETVEAGGGGSAEGAIAMTEAPNVLKAVQRRAEAAVSSLAENNNVVVGTSADKSATRSSDHGGQLKAGHAGATTKPGMTNKDAGGKAVRWRAPAGLGATKIFRVNRPVAKEEVAEDVKKSIEEAKEAVQKSLESSRASLASVTAELESGRFKGIDEMEAERILNEHIERLHTYNNIKDAVQMLFGKLADIRGETVKKMYDLYQLDVED